MNLSGDTIQPITVSEKERNIGGREAEDGREGGRKGESKRGRGRESGKGEEGAGLTGAGLCALPLARTRPQGGCGMVSVFLMKGVPLSL